MIAGSIQKTHKMYQAIAASIQSNKTRTGFYSAAALTGTLAYWMLNEQVQAAPVLNHVPYDSKSVSYQSPFEGTTIKSSSTHQQQQTGQSNKKFMKTISHECSNISKYHPNASCIESLATKTLFTNVRSLDCSNPNFSLYGDRLMNILVEEGLPRLPNAISKTVTTPCGTFDGIEIPNVSELAAVSIIRAGDSLLGAVRRAVPGISVGKVLIQRDEEDELKRPKLLYVKLPPDVAKKTVLLVDPMLATGGSASKAIGELVKAGVPQERIMFLNVVSCPEGLRKLAKDWPKITIVTAAVDQGLNDSKYIVPGLGDFGDRYYGTVPNEAS